MKRRELICRAVPYLCAGVVLAGTAAYGGFVLADDTLTTTAAPADTYSMEDVEEIPDGLTIAGIDASGMTGAELKEAVDSKIAEAGEKTITLTLSDASQELSMKDLGLTWENESEAAEICVKASKGNLIEQYMAGKDIAAGEIDTELVYGIDTDTATEVIQGMTEHFNLTPTSATMTMKDGQIVVTDGTPGVEVDIDEAVQALNDMITTWDGENVTLEIPAEVVEPEYTAEDFAGMTLISTFSTDYWSEGETYSANRNQNVQQGAANVNGHLFMPGEQISTLEMLGTVDAEHGFAKAGVYNAGDSVPEYGGGLCQVATTLYNAYLKVELEIVYRSNHSNTVSYVPLGMDAMIHPQSGKDFIAKNSTGHPLYIEMYCSGHDVVVNLYGTYDNPSNRQVVYRPETILREAYDTEEIADTSMAPGTVKYYRGGHDHAIAVLYKDVYIDGKLTESTLLHRDEYAKMSAIRHYGPIYDANGTQYYINNQGYAVGADGTLYRLNPNGTFLDDPLASTTTAAAAETTTAASGETKAAETTTAAETTAAPTEASTDASAAESAE